MRCCRASRRHPIAIRVQDKSILLMRGSFIVSSRPSATENWKLLHASSGPAPEFCQGSDWFVAAVRAENVFSAAAPYATEQVNWLSIVRPSSGRPRPAHRSAHRSSVIQGRRCAARCNHNLGAARGQGLRRQEGRNTSVYHQSGNGRDSSQSDQAMQQVHPAYHDQFEGQSLGPVGARACRRLSPNAQCCDLSWRGQRLVWNQETNTATELATWLRR